MGLLGELAQYRAWRSGVVHTTLNPEGPGAVRIHLIPPRWRLFGKRPYVVILNGYYVLPLGYSWAVLLEHFIKEINRFDGKPMSDEDMEHVVMLAIKKTHAVYPDALLTDLAEDLGAIFSVLYDVARGNKPKAEIGTISLREYAPCMSAPHRMDLMISSMQKAHGGWNCNLKCFHCYAAGQPAAETTELTTAQWKRILDKCRHTGIPQITFTGGEPTLRKDLPELVGHARWFVTRLNTNGILLSPELCRELKAADLDSVQITLYSYDADIHDKLVGTKGGWQRTIAGLRAALAAGLDVSVNTPLCKDNADYTDTLSFLHNEGVQYVSCSGLIETGKAALDSSLSSQLTKEELEHLLCAAAETCAANGMELSFTSPGQVSPEILKDNGLTVPGCGACLSNMAVAPDGTVVPCQSWLGKGISLGNMLTDKWKRIWNHPCCRNIRNMGETEALHCPLRKNKMGVMSCAEG